MSLGVSQMAPDGYSPVVHLLVSHGSTGNRNVVERAVFRTKKDRRLPVVALELFVPGYSHCDGTSPLP